jgi:lysozyme
MGDLIPQRRIGNAGLKLIKSFEQLRLWPYQDIAGNWTIGYGHLMRPNEHYIVITQQQADNLLVQDLLAAEIAVSSYVRVPLTQDQFDALCSFVFNIGARNFEYSTLLRKLNLWDYEGASEQFVHWDKIFIDGALLPVDGLKRRREAEEQLFLSQQQAA